MIETLKDEWQAAATAFPHLVWALVFGLPGTVAYAQRCYHNDRNARKLRRAWRVAFPAARLK